MASTRSPQRTPARCALVLAVALATASSGCSVIGGVIGGQVTTERRVKTPQGERVVKERSGVAIVIGVTLGLVVDVIVVRAAVESVARGLSQ